ncbi:MAG: SDR family oxidoreductase [Alphaproteobacteria bacterium]
MSRQDHHDRFSLSGRTVLVTGAARGLGWRIARAMAEAGANVLLNGRDPARLADLSSELTGEGLSSAVACFDVADRDAADGWIAVHGAAVDILVNNVGLRHRKPLASTPPDAFSRMLDVNLTAAYGMARGMAPLMAAKGAGVIINVTSIAGPVARANDAAYTAAKGGLAALTRALAVELGPAGIRCNGIAPGYFATEANAAMVGDPGVTALLDNRVPLRRWGDPVEIAGAAVFLASPAASYVNGQVLTVDGGMTASF